MTTSDTYVLAERLNLNNHLYEIGETIEASAFAATNPTTGLLHIAPQTPEQMIEQLRAAGVLKLPLEMQQADDLQAQLIQKQAEMDAMQAELEALRTQAAILPATAAQKKSAAARNPESAPASDSAPLSE